MISNVSSSGFEKRTNPWMPVILLEKLSPEINPSQSCLSCSRLKPLLQVRQDLGVDVTPALKHHQVWSRSPQPLYHTCLSSMLTRAISGWAQCYNIDIECISPSNPSTLQECRNSNSHNEIALRNFARLHLSWKYYIGKMVCEPNTHTPYQLLYLLYERSGLSDGAEVLGLRIPSVPPSLRHCEGPVSPASVPVAAFTRRVFAPPRTINLMFRIVGCRWYFYINMDTFAALYITSLFKVSNFAMFSKVIYKKKL